MGGSIMRIGNGYSHQEHRGNRFDQLAQREERLTQAQENREAQQLERAERREQLDTAQEERRAARADYGNPNRPDVTTLAVGEEDGGGGLPTGPIPVEPDGGIGDGAGPIPFPPEATTLALGEEDGGVDFPVDQNGPPSIGGPAPAEPSEPSRGGGLLFLYSLGPNSIGASNVTLNTDGTGTITGVDVDLTLSGGGFNADGDWVATSGSGVINGNSVSLAPNADGNVFVASGDGGLATEVSVWIEGGTEFEASVVAVAQP